MNATRFLPITLALAAGCISAQRPPEREVHGCYQFHLDEGARALRLPWGIELTEEPLGPGWMVGMRFPDARRAATATSATERADHPFGYWRETAGDSIELGHPGGFGGFTLTLGRSGQDLVGWGSTAGDALPPGSAPPAEPVTAYRVLCLAP